MMDMDGDPVVPDTARAAPKISKEPALSVASVNHLTISSVGLDVPLESMTPVAGTADPPSARAAYWLRGVGVDPGRAARGTVFVVMHSVRGGRGPGNYLIDVGNDRSAVRTGATVRAGSVVYTVTGSSIVPRDKLPADSQVWANTPGRLVMITCLLRREDADPVDNVVITAVERK